MHYSIKRSVGDWNKGAVNLKTDVKTVQRMLEQASGLHNEPAWDPQGVDGLIGHTVSRTVDAIKAFQSGFMASPDGLIEVNQTTWSRLVSALEAAPVNAASPNQGGEYFPFAQLPGKSWTTGQRRFAADRDGGDRAHAGCDLYFPVNTPIYAIAAGTVVKGPYYFYAGTYALEIDHGGFLARYGEVQEDTLVQAGDQVAAGQKIARVGQLVGLDLSMLHLELYDKSYTGKLTRGLAQSKLRGDGAPFYRRKDLIDPTPRLNQWQHRQPTAY